MSVLDRILVTGGVGFLGSHISERLVESGLTIRILDNSWRGAKRNLEKVIDKVEFVEGDVRDYNTVNKVMKGMDTVFHLASIQGTKHFYEVPDATLEVGLIGALNVAKAAIKNKIERILFPSSSEVYGTPQFFPTAEDHPLIIPDAKNPRWSYSIEKIASESVFLNYAKKFGFDATIVRIHNAYGPRMGWEHVIPEFIRRLELKELFTVQGNGSETRSFCYVSDIVDGIILAAGKEEGKNEIFNLGNPKEEYSINSLIKLMGKFSGKNITPIYLERREGSTKRRRPDISKAEKMIGFKPKINLERGFKLTYDSVSYTHLTLPTTPYV